MTGWLAKFPNAHKKTDSTSLKPVFSEWFTTGLFYLFGGHLAMPARIEKMKDLNFSHRIVGLHNNRDISDTISMMANRALGVSHLLALQFESEDSSMLNHELISNAIDSIICELNDIRAYSVAIGKTGQGVKND